MELADIQSKIEDYRQKKLALWSLMEPTSDNQRSTDSEVDKLGLEVEQSFNAVIRHVPSNCHETKLLVEFLVAAIREAVDDCSFIDPLLDLLALKATEKRTA